MLPTRSRTGGLVMVVSLLLTAGLALPATAADSPEMAVDEFFDMVADGDYSRIGEVVCTAEQEAMQEAFDLASGLGLADDDPLVGALSFEIDDRSSELINEDGDAATVAVTATMTMSVPEDQVEEVVRAMLEADHDSDDPPLSDDDVEMMIGFMGSALNQTLPIDQEVDVVREDGGWRVCGGLIDEPEEPDYGIEPTVSSEGLCGHVSPAEMSALSELQYDSSNGFENFCSYSTSDYEDYHTTTVNVEFGQEAESIASAYGADLLVEIAGTQGFATGPDGFGASLITQVGDDVLYVSVALPEDPPEGLDWLTQATLVTELFMPRVADARLELVAPTPAPTPEPTPEIPLCAELSMDELNELTGLGFDEAGSDGASCQFMSIEGEPGFHFVIAYVSEVRLDDYRLWLGDFEEGTVAGQPAILAANQTLVELPGGGRVLDITVSLDESDEGLSITPLELATLLAERLVPGIPAVEAPVEPEIAADDAEVDALLAALEAELAALESGQTTEPAYEPGPVMCDYVDIDAVNALGILEYDLSSSYFEGMCTLTQSDFSDGYSELSVFFDIISIDDVRTSFPDGWEVTVAGLPGFVAGTDLRVWTSVGPIAFSATLPDSAVQAGLQPSDITIPVAEQVIPAIEAAATTE